MWGNGAGGSSLGEPILDRFGTMRSTQLVVRALRRGDFRSSASSRADVVCDELCSYAVDTFGDDEAVLMVDEAGDLKECVLCGGATPVAPAPPVRSRTPRSRST